MHLNRFYPKLILVLLEPLTRFLFSFAFPHFSLSLSDSSCLSICSFLSSFPLALSTIYLSPQSFLVISCYFPELPLEPLCSQTNPGVIELAYRERCCVMFQLPCDEPKGANIDRQFSLFLPPSLLPLFRFSYYSQTRQIRVTRDENGTK